MGKIIQLKPEEIIVGVKFPIEITSLDRYHQILNDSGFRKSHGINKMYFHRMAEPFNANLGSLYLKDGQIQNMGSEDELLSKEPLVVGYKDGGLEYLKGFMGQATGKPSYECRLWIPNIDSELIFYHPVIDKDLVARITK